MGQSSKAWFFVAGLSRRVISEPDKTFCDFDWLPNCDFGCGPHFLRTARLAVFPHASAELFWFHAKFWADAGRTAVVWGFGCGADFIDWVFEHKHDWDQDLWPWHLVRPLIGAELGVVSVLILQAGIVAVGATPQPQPSIPKKLLYYLVVFMVGYGEEPSANCRNTVNEENVSALKDILLHRARNTVLVQIVSLAAKTSHR